MLRKSSSKMGTMWVNVKGFFVITQIFLKDIDCLNKKDNNGVWAYTIYTSKIYGNNNTQVGRGEMEL